MMKLHRRPTRHNSGFTITEAAELLANSSRTSCASKPNETAPSKTSTSSAANTSTSSLKPNNAVMPVKVAKP